MKESLSFEQRHLLGEWYGQIVAIDSVEITLGLSVVLELGFHFSGKTRAMGLLT